MRSDWRSNDTRTYNKFNLLLWHELIFLSLSLARWARASLCHIQRHTLSFDTKINHLFVLYLMPLKSYASLHSLLILWIIHLSRSVCLFLINARIHTSARTCTHKHTFHKESWKEYKSWREMEEHKQTNKQLSQFTASSVVYVVSSSSSLSLVHTCM